MKKYLLNIAFSLIWLAGLGQPLQTTKAELTKEGKQNEEYWKKWQDDLYEVGIKLHKDSLKISTESKKIMQDSAYRKLIFPSTYTWPKAVEFLSQMEVKKAFWYFIKLYTEDTANRKLVIQSLIPFDKALEMDKLLISTFYTYAFIDPKICSFKNNRVLVEHPDILEAEFNRVKEMTAIIRSNRQQVRK